MSSLGTLAAERAIDGLCSTCCASMSPRSSRTIGPICPGGASNRVPSTAAIGTCTATLVNVDVRTVEAVSPRNSITAAMPLMAIGAISFDAAWRLHRTQAPISRPSDRPSEMKLFRLQRRSLLIAHRRYTLCLRLLHHLLRRLLHHLSCSLLHHLLRRSESLLRILS